MEITCDSCGKHFEVASETNTINLVCINCEGLICLEK